MITVSVNRNSINITQHTHSIPSKTLHCETFSCCSPHNYIESKIDSRKHDITGKTPVTLRQAPTLEGKATSQSAVSRAVTKSARRKKATTDEQNRFDLLSALSPTHGAYGNTDAEGYELIQEL